MPVALPLNENQMAVYEQAVKGKDITIKISGRSLLLTRENHAAVRDAVTKLHEKKLKIKSKTIEHMETCYFAQQILEQIERVCAEFTNDNTVGVVSLVPDTLEEEAEVSIGDDTLSPNEDDTTVSRFSSGDTRND
jgi:hypothetical protein